MLLGSGSVHERLLRLGYEERWIAKKVADGQRFRLALFPARGHVTPATWDGVFSTVQQTFPEVAAKVSFDSQNGKSFYLSFIPGACTRK